MEQALPRIKAAGLGLAAVSYDSVAVLKQFSGRAGITFPLLSDSDSAVIRRYGILNETLDKETPFERSRLRGGRFACAKDAAVNATE